MTFFLEIQFVVRHRQAHRVCTGFGHLAGTGADGDILHAAGLVVDDGLAVLVEEEGLAAFGIVLLGIEHVTLPLAILQQALLEIGRAGIFPEGGVVVNEGVEQVFLDEPVVEVLVAAEVFVGPGDELLAYLLAQLALFERSPGAWTTP